MFKLSACQLAEKPHLFRYFYYVFSSLRLITLRDWKAAGEPNPFVEKTYPTKVTEMVDFVDIFDEFRTTTSQSLGFRGSISQAH